ncbi:MAG: phosphate ABC transporter, permease protein PstA [Nitrospinae bacterium CG11_big_fil_rev_8_21_14_0_20_45_15]|nr:MAG: phosphate ABC transporter, permease protein PstA [Nitrospinae bacterium CG11_big_fil_rev_8_21_14_0_20_45_15]
MRNIWKTGDMFIWLTGICLAFALFLVSALLLNLLINGTMAFWPTPLQSFSTATKEKTILGAVVRQELIPSTLPERFRIQIKRGGRDVYGSDFVWLDEDKIQSSEFPAQALIMERREWGDLIGYVEEVRDGEKILATGSEESVRVIRERLTVLGKIHDEIEKISNRDVGSINHQLEDHRLRLKTLKNEEKSNSAEKEKIEKDIADLNRQYEELEKHLVDLRAQLTGSVLVRMADGQKRTVALAKIIQVHLPNQFNLWDKGVFFYNKVLRFLVDDPRESNTEGGVFPAIFGTVMMVLLMSFFAAPLGVLAGFYLREYAKPGFFVSATRIAVNNLAGVPSIVFGVFGVGFFIYFVGGTIDSFFFAESLPTPTFGTGGILWASLTMALLTVPIVIVSTEEGLAAVPRGIREASLALGATKWETSWRIVFPAVMPSILTGLILAMARAAGEVAPLMITGVVKMAPSLPLDGVWPFLHLDQKFMHLGFHIYDVGFQSPNVDAARPMVFATTLLLILIILILNLFAINLRKRLRKKLATNPV